MRFLSSTAFFPGQVMSFEMLADGLFYYFLKGLDLKPLRIW